jgi:ATP-dependent Clp protease ATP-binding subunit ClpA
MAQVIEYAMEEARQLFHTYVGTEHLLLGLMRDRGCRASEILRNLGLDVERVRWDILNRVTPGSPSESAYRKMLEKRFENHPQVQQLKQRIESLQLKLQEAVATTEFETARSYRDQREAVETTLEELYTALGREPDPTGDG